MLCIQLFITFFFIIMSSVDLNIASFNMHGWRNGASMLENLCTIHDIVLIQEHWLLPDNVYLVNSFSKDYSAYAVSGCLDIDEYASTGGRPPGGIGFMWRKSMSKNVCVVGVDDLHRVMAIEVRGLSYKLVIIGVYFPYFVNNDEYDSTVLQCVGFIESILDSYLNVSDCKFMLLGDFNFDCDKLANCTRLSSMKHLVMEYDFCICDNLGSNNVGYTYQNEALGHCSYIDHIFVSKNDVELISQYKVIDSGMNLSDHNPISCCVNNFILSHVFNNNFNKISMDECVYAKLVWTEDVIQNYARVADEFLFSVNVPNCCFEVTERCADSDHRSHLNAFCNSLSETLVTAASSCVVKRRPVNKSFWSSELREMKLASMRAHIEWVNCGRPRVGLLNDKRLSCKSAYKRAIRNAQRSYVKKINDRIADAMLADDSRDFWVTWKKFFGKKVDSARSVGGKVVPVDVSEGFVTSFKTNFRDSNDSVHLKNKFLMLYDEYVCTHKLDRCTVFSVSDIESIIVKLKKNKSAGGDGLTAEHLQFAGGRLYYLLSLLFNSCIKHAFVPDSFGSSVIVPVPKEGSINLSSFDGYRPISLVTIFSKVFESCLLNQLCKITVMDELQFGFTAGKGCQKALMLLDTVNNHFLDGGSNMYTATLDMSKAFDGVNHYGLFIKMMEIDVPLCLLNVAINWYSKLCGRVKWLGCFSSDFPIKSGVRQGGVASPFLFNLYINGLICKLRSEMLGCYLGCDYVGCLLFADDILLMSASLLQLQCMLNVCDMYGTCWDLKFNAKKCHVMQMSSDTNALLPDMSLGNDNIAWVNEMKYLGLQLQSRKGSLVNVDHNCRKFFGAAYGVLQRCASLSELILCEIIVRKCLPILLYGLECIVLNSAQRHKLNVAFNNVMRRIFKVSRRTSVRNLLYYVGIKPVKILLDERRCLLLASCLSSNAGVLRRSALLASYCDDYDRLSSDYGVCIRMDVGLIRSLFHDFVLLHLH